ncbi:hypothetical protein CK203_103414 [Vitis vinifera]|uniref:Uncharacterized protein n=1 Tax=Vitis vinifera TaxID=29760 RepID=A0A438BQY2_VITVI|nr:hypothetical protein CK203_103414 [Vitis vinifera]
MKKTCTKYAAWREKKGTLLNFVCSEINLAIVPTDTWWIDTGATTHISVTMQGCLRSRMPTDGYGKKYDNHSTLPESLWGEVQNAVYILNRVQASSSQNPI